MTLDEPKALAKEADRVMEEQQRDVFLAAEDCILRMAEALDRYGRHEKGCGMLRSPSRMLECSCGLHAAIRRGGLKP